MALGWSILTEVHIEFLSILINIFEIKTFKMHYLPYVPLMSIKPPLRLILLAGMGLGALYMMHLLAQDFNKIRQPVAKLARLLISKRDLNAVLKDGNEVSGNCLILY